MVLVWSWTLECAPKLSQCHFRELPGVTVEPRLCSPILRESCCFWGSWWQNPRRNQGWAVPSAAPSNAGCEGWAEGFGVISCGFGVSWAALRVEIPDLQNWLLWGFGLCLGWGMKTGMSLVLKWWWFIKLKSLILQN